MSKKAMGQIKICGLTDQAGITAAQEADASYVGFVFHPKSPRNINVLEARRLADTLRAQISIVALVVDAEHALIQEIMTGLAPDIVQFHGVETPEQLQHFRAAYPETGIWKAVGIADQGDLAQLSAYHGVADQLLLDAKPPANASRTGGHGATFDWSLLADFSSPVPWLLAGGLTPDNIDMAICQVSERPGFAGVDVSSGVETATGQKDPDLIARFIRAAQSAMHS